MSAAAGEVADGFLCHGFTTERWIREHTIPALRSARAAAGLTLDGFDIFGAPFIATGTDEEIEAGVREARRRVSFYGSTPAYRAVLELHGWGALGDELHTLSRQNKWAEMAELVPDEVVDAFCVIAPPADLPAKLAERYGGLLTRMSFRPPASLAESGEAAALVAALRAIPALSPDAGR
jgi:probable F420-dependent oxidoreductase